MECLLLLYQLALLIKCLRLSELPLQNAAGTLSIFAFVSLILIIISYRPESTVVKEEHPNSTVAPIKPMSRVYKYYAPLLEMLIIGALVNLGCTMLNRDDVVEPYASLLVGVEVGQAVVFGASAVSAWILWRKRKGEASSVGDSSGTNDVVSEVTTSHNTTISTRESASKPSHPTSYAPTY